ncbi:SMC family ATPase [Microbacterium sp. X-17]|uniref:SMC family ATPase n=1 Tax=Microbacterium sp. X-17 TaxID=3144404 RepID=UPI0031F4E816
MRLHRLELEGFGPFRERQVVDFDALAGDGLFLIAGRTGAGKSSILDGVCFALYGGVPRYEGGERRVRSDHCEPDDPTRVVLELTIAGSRWRVSRAPEFERPKRRGAGVTKVAADALLEELVAGEWIGRAAGPRDVALALDEILGLTQQQFLQVVLLAQNRFSQFLLAKNDERQRVLRTLFGTHVHGEYERRLDERRRASEQIRRVDEELLARLRAEAAELAEENGLADADAPADAARMTERAEYRARTATDEVDRAFDAVRAAEVARAAAEALQDRQLARTRSRRALAELDEQAAGVEAARVRLALARDAEALRDVVRAAAGARAAAEAAAQAEADQRTGWIAAGEPDRGIAELRALEERLTGELARWADAVEVERLLEGEAVAARELRARETSLGEELAQRAAARDTIETELADLARRLPGLVAAAAVLDGARAARDDARTRRDAAVRAEVLRAESASAEVARLARARDVQEASAAVATLLQHRLAGFAGELAGALVAGEPCAVCGAVEHPAPARVEGVAVTEEDIAAAERERDRALGAATAATEAALDARAAYEAAAAIAGDATAIDAEEALAAAEAAVATAVAADADRDRDGRRRDELAVAHEELSGGIEGLGADAAALRERLVALDGRIAAARATVETARGEHPSVAARIAETEARRERARAFAEALSERAARESVVADAEAARDARIAGTLFRDAGAVEAALVERAEQEALDRGVREHETAVGVEKERLFALELELADVPEEPVDVAAARASEADARTGWTRAVQAQAQATQLAERLGALRDGIGAAEDADRERAEEHRVLTRLADTVAGRAPNTMRMSLETFVLAAELEEIVDAANVRLGEMSAGRFRLQHTDALARRNAASGLGLEVFDAYTGRARSPQSLSGGETFLASLALALGLAEVVSARAGGIRLDTLFVDEGFGSLDVETLDLALTTLDALRAGGRTVGVISHVEAMREQLPARLAVEATPRGPSVIRQEVFEGLAS